MELSCAVRAGFAARLHTQASPAIFPTLSPVPQPSRCLELSDRSQWSALRYLSTLPDGQAHASSTLKPDAQPSVEPLHRWRITSRSVGTHHRAQRLRRQATAQACMRSSLRYRDGEAAGLPPIQRPWSDQQGTLARPCRAECNRLPYVLSSDGKESPCSRDSFVLEPRAVGSMCALSRPIGHYTDRN